MPDAELIKTIHARFIAVFTELNERGVCRWAAAEAMATGCEGISAVSNVTGLSRVTIRKGIAELTSYSPNRLKVLHRKFPVPMAGCEQRIQRIEGDDE
jgi:hypothetical protein